VDKNGKESDKNCSGCKKVCKKCPSGYYLNGKNNKCKKIPKNCLKVNTSIGKCSQCKSGYRLRGNACVKNKNKWNKYLSKLFETVYWSKYILYFIAIY